MYTCMYTETLKSHKSYLALSHQNNALPNQVTHYPTAMNVHKWLPKWETGYALPCYQVSLSQSCLGGGGFPKLVLHISLPRVVEGVFVTQLYFRLIIICKTLSSSPQFDQNTSFIHTLRLHLIYNRKIMNFKRTRSFCQTFQTFCSSRQLS